MTANVDAMVRDAIRAFKAGKKDEARQLLERATDLDQQNEKAWMWLSAVVDDVEDQRVCLENVLYINPDNANARKGLEYLSKQAANPAPPPPPAPPPAPSVPASPFYEDDVEDDSDDYHVPTSSASADYTTGENLTSADYDDWVAGLNLGGGQSEPVSNHPPEQVPAFDFDDDLFANAFGSDDDDSGFTDPAMVDDGFGSPGRHEEAGDMTSGPFATTNADDLLDDFGLDDFDMPASKEPERYTPAASAPADDLDALLSQFPDELSGIADAPAPMMSPQPKPGEQAAANTRRQARKTRPQPSPERDALYLGGEDLEVNDPGDYFAAIPKTIKPTRLPGMRRSVPLTLVAGLVLLLLLNAGALALLVLNSGT